MESQVKQLDSEHECYKVEIKEEVCFELIEDQSCIDAINDENEIKEENAEFVKPVDDQSLTCDGLINEIKKENLTDIERDEEMEYSKADQEINYVWPEVALDESDPLALPEIKHRDETQNSEEEEALATVGLSTTSSGIDFEIASLKEHDPSGEQYIGGDREHNYPYSHTGNIYVTEHKDFEYSFNQSSSPNTNMKSHYGEKLYQCKECDFFCWHSSKLKIHMRRHNGEKPYKCMECDYTCSQSSSLTIHMRKHNGVEPYQCKECDYTSSQSCNLKVHMEKHIGDKPYQRQECDYTCEQSSSFKAHMKKHNEDKPYQCKECDYTCKQMSTHEKAYWR